MFLSYFDILILKINLKNKKMFLNITTITIPKPTSYIMILIFSSIYDCSRENKDLFTKTFSVYRKNI